MAFIAGIDEAGYGPLLGPLVVSATVFEVPDGNIASSLWELLSGSVTGKPGPRDRRLPILDSKKLYNRKEGLAGLERTALIMLRLIDQRPATFRELLACLCPHHKDQAGAYPWYRDHNPSLPMSTSEGDVATRLAPLRRDCQAASVRFCGVHVEPLLEGDFNRLVASTRNKAAALMGLSFRLIHRILRDARGQKVFIGIDRQGGRSHYASTLLTHFDRYDLRILDESESRSAYGLAPLRAIHSSDLPREATIEFVTGGEEVHLPIALASIFSKYVRELFMRGFNRYWTGLMPHVAETAGYYEDGHRFLKEIEPALRQTKTDRDWLVRSR